jgi:hypothetical protein
LLDRGDVLPDPTERVFKFSRREIQVNLEIIRV